MTSDTPIPGRVVIAGGSGVLGLRLAQHLSALSRPVTILSRSTPKSGPWDHATWDGRTLDDWTGVLDGADAIVNLTGRSVDCVKTPDHCDEILRSRVEPTRLLGQACRDLERPPPVWVQMSTAHIYGDPPTAVCREDAPFGYGLAPTVGMAWERALAEAAMPEQRTVLIRTSFVLARDEGALARLGKLTRWGLGGTVGRGTQGMSWIHVADLNRLFERAIDDESMRGPYIASSPHPVSNREFMRTLRTALGRRIGLPAPEPLVRFGARFVLHTDPELALYGRYVVSKRLADEGFEFEFPELSAALTDVYQ